MVFHHFILVCIMCLVRDQAYREKVAMEIMQTEKDYVSQLETCVTVFLEPLEKALSDQEKKPPMKAEQVAGVFMNVREIYTFHKKFSEQLTERIGSGPWTASKCLGDIFLELKDITEAYSTYAQQYPRSIEVFDAVCTTKACEAFLAKCKEKSRLDLPSLLITPIQRIPRYNLLLMEYNKHTWAEHKDKPMLATAIATVRTMADTINKSKSQVESELRLKQLCENVRGVPESVVKPGRIVVREATFNDKKRDTVCLVLFNDAMMWYKPSVGRGKGKFHECLDLWCLKLIPNPDDELSFEIERSGKTMMRLTAKESVDAVDWKRIWRDTKAKYDEVRAQARQEGAQAQARAQLERHRRRESHVQDAAHVLIDRSKSRAKKGEFYGPMTPAERKETIEGLYAQRIAIQQQLLSMGKLRGKPEEFEALRVSLCDEMENINKRLTELGAVTELRHVSMISPRSSSPEAEPSSDKISRRDLSPEKKQSSGRSRHSMPHPMERDQVLAPSPVPSDPSSVGSSPAPEREAIQPKISGVGSLATESKRFQLTNHRHLRPMNSAANLRPGPSSPHLKQK